MSPHFAPNRMTIYEIYQWSSKCLWPSVTATNYHRWLPRMVPNTLMTICDFHRWLPNTLMIIGSYNQSPHILLQIWWPFMKSTNGRQSVCDPRWLQHITIGDCHGWSPTLWWPLATFTDDSQKHCWSLVAIINYPTFCIKSDDHLWNLQMVMKVFMTIGDCNGLPSVTATDGPQHFDDHWRLSQMIPQHIVDHW